ncbi:MAG: hypothetical protein WC713_11675 [Candidatus Methylomirabilota bacterium]
MRHLKLRRAAPVALASALVLLIAWSPAWASSERTSQKGKNQTSSRHDHRDSGKGRQEEHTGKHAPTVKSCDSRQARDGRDGGECGIRPGCGTCGGIGLAGAIFTTNEFGTVVNGNLYDSALDVYLSVGRGSAALRADHLRSARKSEPVSCRPETHAKGRDDDGRCHEAGGIPAGLPDGLYYFQVTDPSGKSLLSLDSIEERQFEVVAGYIQGLVGSHQFNVLEEPFPRNYTVIQLAPYLPTPNRGGEYKVWVTPVDAYRAGQGSHGFVARYSKTDNFKVRSGEGAPTAFILGGVFGDVDLNGEYGASDLPAPNVQVNLYAQGGTEPLDHYVTGSAGQWSFQVSPPSLPFTYRVEPVVGTGVQLAPTLPPVYEVTVGTSGQMVEGLLFGVVEVASPIIPVGDQGEVSGGNIEFYPGYWVNDSTSLSQGEAVLAAYLADYYDFSSPDGFLNSSILQQACPSAIASPLSLDAESAFLAVQNFLRENSAETAAPTCRIAALWLSLNLAIETGGTPVDTAILPAGEVQTVTGAETIYLGLLPGTTPPQPAYGTLRGLLDDTAANFTVFSPEEAAFCADALQQAADKQSFVRGFSGESENF